MENEEIQDIDLENNEETTEETTVDKPVDEEAIDYKAEAAKWRAIAERNKKKAPISKKRDDDFDPKEAISRLELAERKRQFAYENQLSPDETDRLFKINPNPSKADLDDPFVKAGIEGLRAKKRIENGTPSPSSNSPKINGKTFEEMDDADRAKNYEAMMRAKAEARARR